MLLSRFRPVKALMISRYVRKEWRRLYFSDQYSNIQFMRNKLSAGSKFQFGYFVDEVSTGNLRMETLDFSCQLPHDPTKEWCAVNSCNGLVCLVNEPVWPGGTNDNSVVCVCNPILGEWISIPIPDRNCSCALGFSAKTNQYKILLQSNGWKIYTLGTGGHWRSIETEENIMSWSFNHDLPFNSFIHGSLHWTNRWLRPIAVQSFNFDTERFTVFSLPECESTCITAEYYLDVALGVINGRLWASFHNCMQYDDGEMWAMKEYGNEESWTMTLAWRNMIEYDTPDEELLARHKELVIYKDDHLFDHKLLVTLNGEEMLVRDDGHFVCYNIKKMRYRSARPARLRSLYKRGMGKQPFVIAYNPSFVSLHDVGKGEQVIRGEFPGKCDKFGGYKCADCGSPRYKSGTRFNSSCGYPGAIRDLTKDPDGWRTEISCRACGAPCVQRGGGYTFASTAFGSSSLPAV